MMELKIIDLYASVDGKEILKGIDLTIKAGETHALMGPNGSGKSTLANVLMGHPKYEVTKGRILIDGTDIVGLPADKRAKLGLFLSFQYPLEIPGVTVESFLRTAYNTINGTKIDVVQFNKLLKERMNSLNIDPHFSRRYLNEGFSGGEKKRMEILQMSVLDPKIMVLDETDSGLDVDALKVVSEGIGRMRDDNHGFLIITHFNRILKLVEPDHVHIIVQGRIVKSGGKDLAHEVESRGYEEHK
jgi:Fe-S cluster assembly ATP-binding protein